MNRQDELLNIISDKSQADLLYDLWTITQRAPTRMAEILVQFKDVTASTREATRQLEDCRQRIAGMKDGAAEIRDLVAAVAEWSKTVASVNEDVVLNRLNRILDVAEKVRQLKHSGALEMVKTLLEKKP